MTFLNKKIIDTVKNFINHQDYAGLLAWVNESHHRYFKKWQVKFNKAFNHDPSEIAVVAYELLKDLRTTYYRTLQTKLGINGTKKGDNYEKTKTSISHS